MTSLVIDKEEFDGLCDESVAKNLLQLHDTNTCKNTGHIPLIMRGSKTAFIFERYDIKTDFVAVIVRGNGRKV